MQALKPSIDQAHDAFKPQVMSCFAMCCACGIVMVQGASQNLQEIMCTGDDLGCEQAQHAQHAKQQALIPLHHCSSLLSLMTWDHLDSDLCQHVTQ